MVDKTHRALYVRQDGKFIRVGTVEMKKVYFGDPEQVEFSVKPTVRKTNRHPVQDGRRKWKWVWDV